MAVAAGMFVVVAAVEAEAAEVVGEERLRELGHKLDRIRQPELDVDVPVLAVPVALGRNHDPVLNHATALAPDSVVQTPAPGPHQDLALN